VIPEIESEAVPVLVSVTACDALVVATVWLANVKLVGDKLTVATGACAVPFTAMFVGVFNASLATAIVPDCAPAEVGTKLTFSVVDSPAFNGSGKLIPLTRKLLLLLSACEIVTLASLLLLSTAVAAALWPTVTASNDKLGDDILRVPAPFPCDGYS
jgi:hypothetical protein